jgi:hypothetical protein
MTTTTYEPLTKDQGTVLARLLAMRTGIEGNKILDAIRAQWESGEKFTEAQAGAMIDRLIKIPAGVNIHTTMQVENPTPPAVVKSVKIPEGTYTVLLDADDYVTLRVEKASFIKDADKTMVSYLYGPDNDLSYKGFAFVNTTGIAVWSKFKNESRIVKAANILWNIAQAEAGLIDAHELFLQVAEAYALRSGNCIRCGKTLTVPASLTRGLGPVCAGREGL